MINWKVSKKDAAIIARIVDRATNKFMRRGKPIPLQLELSMDITACHANGCKLDLERLIAADDFNFAHDVAGIRGHIDRETGQLTDCFVPRFAKRVFEPWEKKAMKRKVIAA